VTSLGPVHLAVTCVVNSAGQPVCSETSPGLFGGLGLLLVVEIAFAVLGIVAAVKVVTKAGYSAWWVLIAFVPIVGSVFMIVFAFSTWPVTRELDALRGQVVGRPGYGVTGGYPTYPGYRSGQSEPVPPTGVDVESVSIPSFGQFMRGETAPGDAPAAVPAASGQTTRHPPPGWFPAPGGPAGRMRYWDGTAWTDHYA
jgi:hypothetical protein